MKKVFVLTNHNTTQDQVTDLQKNWGATLIVELPKNLKILWGTIPPNADSVAEYTQPVIDWLVANCTSDDLVWAQGEWGATLTALLWCAKHSINAIYSTTKRVATETKTDKGTVMTHVFKHIRFRKYPI